MPVGNITGTGIFEHAARKRWEAFCADPTRGGGGALTPSLVANFVKASSQSLSITDAAQTGLDMGTSDFSISCWMRIPALLGTSENNEMVSKRAGASSAGYDFRLQDAAGTDTLRGGIQASASAAFQSANNPFVIDTWYHCVGTYDRDGNGSLFINNAASGTPSSIASQAASIDNATAFSIGSHGATANYFNGRISAVGLWSKLLSAGEMTTLYNSGVPLLGAGLTGTLLTSLVDFWDLNGDGNSRSGANNLTNNNSVTFVAYP